MESGNGHTDPGKPRPGDSSERDEIAEYAREVARVIEARLKEAQDGSAEDGKDSFLEVLLQIDHPGRCLCVIDFHKDGGKRFSEREAEVAEYWLKGRSEKEIAREVRLSPRTVHHNVERMRTKLSPAKWTPLRVLGRPEVLDRFAAARMRTQSGSAAGEAKSETQVRHEDEERARAKSRRPRR
jgi:DNA-binding NarL/FixJ family response regulator